MHVGRHLVASRIFEPEDEWFRFVWIAIQNRDLCPLRAGSGTAANTAAGASSQSV